MVSGVCVKQMTSPSIISLKYQVSFAVVGSKGSQPLSGLPTFWPRIRTEAGLLIAETEVILK